MRVFASFCGFFLGMAVPSFFGLLRLGKELSGFLDADTMMLDLIFPLAIGEWLYCYAPLAILFSVASYFFGHPPSSQSGVADPCAGEAKSLKIGPTLAAFVRAALSGLVVHLVLGWLIASWVVWIAFTCLAAYVANIPWAHAESHLTIPPNSPALESHDT